MYIIIIVPKISLHSANEMVVYQVPDKVDVARSSSAENLFVKDFESQFFQFWNIFGMLIALSRNGFNFIHVDAAR